MVLDNPIANNRDYSVVPSEHTEGQGKTLAADLWKEWETSSAGKLMGRIKETVSGTVLDFGAIDPYAKPGHAKVGASKPEHSICEAAADAIDKACNQGIYGVAGTDKEAIYKILEGKTEAESKEIDKIFKEKYGKHYTKEVGPDGLPKWGLKEELKDELSGADLDKALNLLNRRDGDAGDAGRIQTALIERGQWSSGRSGENCEKDIRDTLATMNSEQIQQLKEDFRKLAEQKNEGKTRQQLKREGNRYFEPELKRSLLDDTHLSKPTKEAIEIYLKGSDKRNMDKDGKSDPYCGDTMKLADIALKGKSMDMFQEAFRDAPPEARKTFQNSGGAQKILDVFGPRWSDGLTPHTVSSRAADVVHAVDYVKSGTLSTSTKVRDNTSWSGDNEKAIEKSLHDMNESERQAYLRGRELDRGKTPESKLTEKEKNDLTTYRHLHGALEKAGNRNELSRWEDQIAHKDGSLVSKLSKHRGSIYDDSMNDVLGTVESMSKADWDRLKKDPHFREEIEKQLKTYLSKDELVRAMAVVDEKAKAKTYHQADSAGRRPLLDAIKDAKGYSSDNEDNIYDAIKNMSPKERAKYKADEDFRKQVDDRIKSVLDKGPEQEAAFRLLKQFEKSGESPKEDLTTRLLMHAGRSDTDEGQVVRELQKAIREDHRLTDRLKDPNSEESRALHKALDRGEYEKYAKPLIDMGFLPAATQMELSKGVFDDHEQDAYKDLAALGRAAAMSKDPQLKSHVLHPKTDEDRALAEQWKGAAAERNKILGDKNYQDKVLGFLSEDERAVALNALRQGQMRPEDVMRSQVVGAGTGEEEVKAALGNLSAQRKEEVTKAYAEKYKSDLTYDIIDEMSGQDKREALRSAAREPASPREAYNRVRDEYYERYDGAGKERVNKLWDGTGYGAESDLNEFSAKMTEFSAKFQELPLEQRQELTERLRIGLDQFTESKGAAADALVDASIAVVAVGGALVTEGVSLGLLAGTGFGAALFKPAAKALLMGSDYELSMAGLDAATGFVDGSLAFLGPSEVGSLLKIGARGAEAAAAQAGKTLVGELGEVAAKEVLKGGEEALEKAMTRAVRDAMVNGSYKVDDKVIERMVKELAREGASEADKAALRKALTGGTELGVRAVSDGMSKAGKVALEYFLNASGGALGGGGSGMIRGFAEWDPNKSFGENLATVGKITAMSAGFGAGGGVAFTAVFHAGGAAFHGIREHFKTTEGLKEGERLTDAQLKEAARLMGVKDGELKYNEHGDLILTGSSEVPPATHTDLPAGSRDGSNGGHDVTSTDRDIPAAAQETPRAAHETSAGSAEVPASKFQEKVDPHGNKYVEFPTADGDPTKLYERGGWYYPEGVVPEGNAARGVKIHVLTSDPADLGQLERILLGEIKRDPELAGLIRGLKMQDPRLADSAFAAQQGKLVGHGQEQKAFTLGAKSAEDAARLQKKLDEVLARHPELKLEKPIAPEGMDRIVGESGRIGVVRDFYAQGVDVHGEPGARLDKNLSDRIHQDPNLQHGADGRLTDKALRDLERKTGLKDGTLAYDQQGNLILKGSDEKVDRFDLIERVAGKPTDGDRFSQAQLRAAEKQYGFKEDTFYYDEGGNLMKKETPARDGNFYLKEQGGSSVSRSETDPRTGQPSNGLTDRFAYYNLGDQYGVSPIDGCVTDSPHPVEKGPSARGRSDVPPESGRGEGKLESGPKSEALPREAAEDPEMNWADISPEKRLEMVDRAKRSELYKPEAVDDFVARAQELTSEWNDQSHIVRQFDESRENLAGAQGRYKTEVEEPLAAVLERIGQSPEDTRKLLQNSDAVRKVLKNDKVIKLLDSEEIHKAFPHAADADGRLKAGDQLSDARKAFADEQQLMDAAVWERREQIQKMMDDYTDDHGLARVRVRLADEIGASGTYRPGDGVLSVNRSDVLAAREPASLIDTMYHELAHAEQDSLVIRHLVEKAHLEKVPPSAEDLDFLKVTYEAETGRTLSDKHLNNVLEAARDPKSPQQFKPLNEADTARAIELIADQQKHPWPGEKVTQWNNDIRVAKSELSKLNADPNQSMWLIDKLAQGSGDSKALCRRLFGSETPPPEIQRLMDTYKDPAKTFDTDLARRILAQRIEEGVGVNEAVVKDAWRRYFDNPDEQEAWLLGKRAGIAARESGVPGPDQSPDMVTDLDPHLARPM